MFTGACAVTWGCSNNLINNTQRQPERLNVEICQESSNSVDLFFTDDIADFKYTKLAYVKAEANYEDEPAESILNRLKCEARKNCANGIINIRRELKRERVGNQFQDMTMYSGIAITVNNEGYNTSAYLNAPDASFIPQDVSGKEKENKKRDWANGIRVILLSIVLVASTVGL